MRKRRFLIVLLAPLVPLVAVLVILVGERIRGHVSLARYKRDLIAKGERLSPPDFMTREVRGENGAPEIFEAVKQLKEGSILPKGSVPRMRLTASGRAIVCSREPEWVQSKVTNHWEKLAADLEANAQTLETIRLALEKPVLDNQLDYSQPLRMSFRHLAPAKSIANWFGAASQLALHEGMTGEAVPALSVEARLPRLLIQDRLVISELVRIAIGAIAKADLWEALQAGPWSDQALAELQSAWASSTFLEAMTHGLEGERMFGEGSFQAMSKSNDDTIQVIFGLDAFLDPDESERPAWERAVRSLPAGEKVAEFLKKQVYCRLWRFAWMDQDERHYLEFMQRLIELARKAAAEKSYSRIQTALDHLHQDVLPQNIYDRLRYPKHELPFTLSRALERAVHAETDRSMAICAIAIKRYALRHGNPPSSLAVLAPELLSSVPTDYMDGMPLKYRLNPDGTFILYSVGDDGTDDGGDGALAPGKTIARSIWNRKDALWPLPATPDEVEAYRKEAAKD